MKNSTRDGRKVAVGKQRMSYDTAKRQMERNGWTNPTEEMTWIYSYVGKNHFSGLMDRAFAMADIEIEYLEKATGRKLTGTPISRQIHMYRRAKVCTELMQLIFIETKEKTSEQNYLKTCNADNKEEMTRDVFESHKKIDPEVHIGTLDREFKQMEGWDKEFGSGRYGPLSVEELEQIRYGLSTEGTAKRNF